ncbi:MAG: peroxidase [Phycisphaerae bacterium]|nr:peroxidase [Phycisphaerae bacterium]MBM91364.1 peroxidase [Phycisphaerae bacterium]HCT45835.1 peroxidase [Phycisphaerales bacterium]|tara:strand:+ start:481 stop:1035 length:555 start_codon:yes stop_codon:yes gene_type:complete
MTMPRIEPTSIEQAPESTKATLEHMKQQLGMVPNLLGTLGKSPAALNSYVKQKEALATGTLGDKFGESLALAIANFSKCGYCAAAHNAIGKMVGLSDEERELNRKGQSGDPKTQSAIDLAKAIVENRGFIGDEALEAAHTQLSEEEILEVVAITTFNLFTNYMNHVIETENDFPEVELVASAAV